MTIRTSNKHSYRRGEYDKQKQKTNIKKKKTQARTYTKEITAVLLIIPVLIASGIFAYLYTHPVSLKKSA